MNLDAQILSLVRQEPDAVPLHHLCLLIFPTFSWSQMSPISGFIRWRCHELVRAGRLHEVAQDYFVAVARSRIIYHA